MMKKDKDADEKRIKIYTDLSEDDFLKFISRTTPLKLNRKFQKNVQHPIGNRENVSSNLTMGRFLFMILTNRELSSKVWLWSVFALGLST